VIHGVGVDIVKIGRLRKSVDNSGERFLERIFTGAEIEFCRRRKDPFPCLAARFAAKEALIKAASAGAQIPLTEIEVRNDGEGKPHLNMQGWLGETLGRLGVQHAHLSLSHERDYAVACVVLEG
jgi:holo-[acyl-carrier protein] synthase